MDRRTFLIRAGAAISIAPSVVSVMSHAGTLEKSEFDSRVRASALAGFTWLANADPLGWNPALNRPGTDHNLLRIAGSYAALARATQCFALLALDNIEPQGRAIGRTTAEKIRRKVYDYFVQSVNDPESGSEHARPRPKYEDANPVALAGLLVLAMEELGVERSEEFIKHTGQLARFLSMRQRPEGTFCLGPSDDPADDDGIDDIDAVAYYPGEALYALIRGHRIAGESWRLEAVARAFAPYRDHWRRYRQQAFIPWQSCAYSEMYLATKEQKYADFVFEMNDWLLPLQYRADSRCPKGWAGGFDCVWNGERMRQPPGASTGSYAESLVDAVRVAKAAGDARRVETYQAAMEAAFEFLMSIQYTDGNTNHFQPELRERVRGATHGSVDDGTVRIDFTQHALMAMCNYLMELAGG